MRTLIFTNGHSSSNGAKEFDDTVSLLEPMGAEAGAARTNRSDSYHADDYEPANQRYNCMAQYATPVKANTSKGTCYTPPTPPLTPSPQKQQHQHCNMPASSIKTAADHNQQEYNGDDDSLFTPSLPSPSVDTITPSVSVDPPGLCFQPSNTAYLCSTRNNLMSCYALGHGGDDDDDDKGTLRDYELYTSLGETSTAMVQNLLSMVDKALLYSDQDKETTNIDDVSGAVCKETALTNPDEKEDGIGESLFEKHWTICKQGASNALPCSFGNAITSAAVSDISEMQPVKQTISPAQLANQLPEEMDKSASNEVTTITSTETKHMPDDVSETFSQDDEVEAASAEDKMNAPSFTSGDDAADKWLIPCNGGTNDIAEPPTESSHSSKTSPLLSAPAAQGPPMVETFEMILEETTPSPKLKLFWPFRRRRSSRRKASAANLNVVPTESCSSHGDEEGSISLELIPEPTQMESAMDVNDDSDDDDFPVPFSQAANKELKLLGCSETEEEKKEDDDADSTMFPSVAEERLLSKSNKESRYKHLLGNLLSHRLTPVKEEPAIETDAFVRVPGLQNPDKFLSSDDLLGEECTSHERSSLQGIVEEEDSYSDDDIEEEQGEIASRSSNEENRTCMMSTDGQDMQFVSSTETTTKAYTSHSLVATMKARTRFIVPKKAFVKLPSRPWTLSCQNQNVSQSVLKDVDDMHAMTIAKQSMLPVTHSSVTERDDFLSTKKRVWKTAICASSGRTYWYNRETRATTWAEPPEDEIVQPNTKVQTARSEKMSEKLLEAKADKNQAAIIEITQCAKSDYAVDEMTERPSDEARVSTPKDVAKVLESPEVTVERSDTPGSEYERRLWAVKEDIVAILKTLAPAEGPSVTRLLSQFDGQEDQLLSHLLNISESKPFDEPLEKVSSPEPTVLQVKPPLAPKYPTSTVSVGSKPVVPTSPIAMTRVQTHVTQISHQSNITESTVHVKNTFNPDKKKRSGSETSSLSSARQQVLLQRNRDSEHLDHEMSANPVISVDKIHCKVPVARSRELVVEEFNSSGCKAQTFDVKNRLVTARKPFLHARLMGTTRSPSPAATKTFSEGTVTPINYLGDAEDGDTEDVHSHPGDSISALSEADYMLDYSNHNGSQRCAVLDEATTSVEKLGSAAALPGGSRSKAKMAPQAKGEWAQTELDRYISEHDWDAVTSSMGQGRTIQKPATGTATSQGKLRKRFGARSQLQHNGQPREGGADLYEDFESLESWETGGSVTSYESEDYSVSVGSVLSSSGSESLPRRRRGQKRVPARNAAVRKPPTRQL
ncbi:hypothetical protein MPSEU_000930800 [Mayamaea pseudoterrestris]|nr:hypothetical protein MPSEU_000930800 [Mayamaea pseudoterrestris]